MDSNLSAKLANEVAELLDFANTEEWKNLLWQWFKNTVAGSYDQLSKKEKKNIITVYEKMDEFMQRISQTVTNSKKDDTNL